MPRLDSMNPMAGIPAATFAKRRKSVFQALGAGVLVLPAAPYRVRSRDTEHPYRPDSELFYVTGATEPGTVAVFVGSPDPLFVLFVRERDPEAELWSGVRLGPEDAAELFGADETLQLKELDARLPGLLQQGDKVHYRLGAADRVERIVLEALAQARLRGARKGTGPRAVVDPGELLDELRLRKDAHEIERIRRAAKLTAEGHRAAFAAARPGQGEWLVQAAVDAAFRLGGGSGPGYGTIVGSGPNACVLHYETLGRTLEKGDLVLVDAGAEVALYSGDVTRTFPASGRFTATQRAVYDVVEEARAAAVAAVGPGRPVTDVHDAALRVIVDGLVKLDVLEGSVDDLIQREAYKPWFPHQTSHWLGLDVHDPGDYSRDGVPRVLEPGMVLTVEPGLYFRPGMNGRAARFEGIGVRIEDDVLVTKRGRANLSKEMPTEAGEVEALVRELR